MGSEQLRFQVRDRALLHRGDHVGVAPPGGAGATPGSAARGRPGRGVDCAAAATTDRGAWLVQCGKLKGKANAIEVLDRYLHDGSEGP